MVFDAGSTKYEAHFSVVKMLCTVTLTFNYTQLQTAFGGQNGGAGKGPPVTEQIELLAITSNAVTMIRTMVLLISFLLAWTSLSRVNQRPLCNEKHSPILSWNGQRISGCLLLPVSRKTALSLPTVEPDL
jgi:hypothetical protein